MSSTRRSTTVAVVLAAYNAGAWIRNTVQSVLDQSYPADEVILIDDGSTDDTAVVARSFGSRLHYIVRAHAGQPAARNAGIRASSARFVAFCDADDLWHPRKLQEQIKLAVEGDSAWVVCDAAWMHEDGTWADIRMPPVQQGDVLEALFLGNFIKSATPLVRRDVFDTVGFFDESAGARIGEDWDMWLRIAARYPLAVVREPLATIRLHGDSMLARSSAAERANSLEAVVERAAMRNPNRLARLKSRALAEIWHGLAVELARAERFDSAADFFGKELHCWPPRPAALLPFLLCRLGPKIAGPSLRLKRLL